MKALPRGEMNGVERQHALQPQHRVREQARYE